MSMNTLKYGMEIKICAQSPLAGDNDLYYITNYKKHNLITLDQGNPLTMTIISTKAQTGDVCYGDKVILLSKDGLVFNNVATGTWGTGYLTLAEKSQAGEVHFIISRPSMALSLGAPIVLDDCATGCRLQLHFVPAKAHNVPPKPLTAQKQSSSASKGGYIRTNGNGVSLGFNILSVSSSTDQGSSSSVASAATTATAGQSSSHHEQSVKHSIVATSPSIAGGGNTNDEFNMNTGEAESAPNGDDRAGTTTGTQHPPIDRPINPPPYDLEAELKPLRYGDRIRLTARSQYYPEGGYVGMYLKHGLAGVGPLRDKSGNPIDPENCEDFHISEFIITGTGPKAQRGDIVRFAATVVLVDANNGNSVWNCRDTDTWTSGYLTEGPISKTSTQLPLGVPGPPLLNANFDMLTNHAARDKLPEGQLHVSLQSPNPLLSGYPIHDSDTILIDAEDSHRKKGKLNNRLSVFKKQASMLSGGYLVCVQHGGKPVNFQVDRIEAVPLPTVDPFNGMYSTDNYSHLIQTNETCFRRDSYAKPDRLRVLAFIATLIFGALSLVYFLSVPPSTSSSSSSSIQHNTVPESVLATAHGDEDIIIDLDTNTSTENIHQGQQENNTNIEQLCIFGLTLTQLYNIKRIIYMICALISACCGVYYSTLTSTQQIKGQKVTIPRNHLDHIKKNAASKTKVIPEWMILAGLDPENIVVPQRYIDAEKGNEIKGKARYLVTTKWQTLNNINTILQREHPLFRIIKKNTNQFFAGKAKSGYCVYYESPKLARLDEFKRLGVSIEDLLYHFVYITEYLYQVMDKRDDAKCVSVVDCTNVGISDLGGEALAFLQAVAKITQTHYPERSAGIYCLNTPWAFRVVWNLVSGLMDPVTRSKTFLWSSDYIDNLTKHIDQDQIPKMFHGTSAYQPTIPAKGPKINPNSIEERFNEVEILPLSPDEEDMFKIADKVNVEFGRDRKLVAPNLIDVTDSR